LIAVNSNVADFYDGFTFQQTHTPRNASVALLLQAGIGRFLYASGYDYRRVFIGATFDTAYSDPVTLPMFSTEAIDLFLVGGQYTRVEKTLRIASLEDTPTMLDVCAGGAKAGNCSTCRKCLRTLLTLEIAGLIDQYDRAFDLAAYALQRDRYIIKVLRCHDPLLQELVSFAREHGLACPLHARLHATLARPLARLKHSVRRQARERVSRPLAPPR
jgi:hypothetical protein